MSKPKSITLAVTTTIVAISAMIGGITLRDRTDHGPTQISSSEMASRIMFASKADDVDIPESDYFVQLLELLQKVYVEKINDEMKMASGAVRGMVLSLSDPLANFMSKEQYSVFQRNLGGDFEGIGIEVSFDYRPEDLKASQKNDRGLSIPDKFLVSAVVPGGPADQAGIKVGDQITSIGGRWIMLTGSLKDLGDDIQKIRTSKLADSDKEKKLDAINKKIKLGLMPFKARDQVMLGASGAVALTWSRGSEKLSASITKAKSTLPAVTSNSDGTISLRVLRGAAEQLSPAIEGKASITIDLRDSTIGDYDELPKVAALLLPAGNYGMIQNEKSDTGTAFSVPKGRDKPLEVTIIADKSTRGAAEILALALETSKHGKFSSAPGTTAGERAMIQVVGLPDGAGYTIPTGRYETSTTPKPTQAPKAKKKVA